MMTMQGIRIKARPAAAFVNEIITHLGLSDHECAPGKFGFSNRTVPTIRHLSNSPCRASNFE
jgi:hypothetical protein